MGMGLLWACWALTAFTSAWLMQVVIAAAHALDVGIDKQVGVQKFHSHRVPRLGGVGISVALASGLLLSAWLSDSEIYTSVAFIVCLLPAFGIGLLEDLTAKAGVLARLVFTMVSAALAWWLLVGRLNRLDLGPVDAFLMASPAAAFILTLVAASGVAHAINIIDGYNGLSAFVAAVILSAIAYVAWRVDDVFVLRASLLTTAALVGFLAWNFPYGRIFMGDAGAYVVGFVVGELSILLVARNPTVSPWFPMLLAAYPVTETLFSMYRKKVLRGISPGEPDGLHLHMLVYRRLVRLKLAREPARQKLLRNSVTGAYLCALPLLTAVPALLLWSQSSWLIAGVALFVLGYLRFYWSIVRFELPPALVLRSPLPNDAAGLADEDDEDVADSAA